MSERLRAFVRESNRIEGIVRRPTHAEMVAHEAFLALDTITANDLGRFVAVIAPGKCLRVHQGMDVRVGRHVPPPGGPGILHRLTDLLARVGRPHLGSLTAFAAHVEYETLHPFMDGNGRSGRALWLWMMHGDAPLGFLHTFYYQSLDASQVRPPALSSSDVQDIWGKT